MAYDREASAMCNNVMNTQWDFNTNITEATKQRMVSYLTFFHSILSFYEEAAGSFYFFSNLTCEIKSLNSCVTIGPYEYTILQSLA